jgi:hypothetical protein
VPAKKKQPQLLCQKISKPLITKVVIGIVILAIGFGGGIMYQKHVNNENTPVTTPYLCNCPMLPVHPIYTRPSCC